MLETSGYPIGFMSPLFALDDLFVTKGGIINLRGWAASVAFDYPAYDHFFYDTNLKRKSDIYGWGLPTMCSTRRWFH